MNFTRTISFCAGRVFTQPLWNKTTHNPHIIIALVKFMQTASVGSACQIQFHQSSNGWCKFSSSAVLYQDTWHLTYHLRWGVHSEHWKRLRDWPFFPSVIHSVYMTHNGNDIIAQAATPAVTFHSLHEAALPSPSPLGCNCSYCSSSRCFCSCKCSYSCICRWSSSSSSNV